MKKWMSVLSVAVAFILTSGFNIFGSDTRDVNVCIKMDAQVNGGTPLYVYVKEVDKSEFLKEDYDHVVLESVSSSVAEAEFKSQVLIPGKNYEIRFPRKNPNKLIGVYFLFTQPGENWKLLCDPTKRVRVELEGSEIVRAHNE